MGYYTRFSGEVRIVPPLTWAEVKDSPWLSPEEGDLMLRLDVEEEPGTDGSAVTRTRRTAGAIVPIREDAYRGYHADDHLQEIVEAFPGHEFTGHISAEGEEAGDLWRLAVRDGKAVRDEPRILWPGDPDY